MRIQKDESLGLIIDIQERLLPHIHESEKLLSKTLQLIEGLKILEIPIIVTEQYPKGLGLSVPEIASRFSPFTPIEKISFSCCDNDDFYIELDAKEKRNIIIAGIESHVCVLQTCLDLKKMGYQPIIVADCIGSRNPYDKEIALQRLMHECAIITTCESILFELTRVAGNDVFKAISKIVK